jgi:hypothetical protein
MLVGLACVLVCGCGGSDGGSVLTGPITVATVQAQVFTPHCALSGCHTGPDPRRGLDLSPGEAWDHLIDVPADEINQFMRVDPGNAADSYLYMKITGDPRILGDPMPFEQASLSEAKIGLIERWIEQGANP